MIMWVFGYGSLLWNPGFASEERALAILNGYHRSFCMRSIHHRGTPEAPGLVLALDERPGSACNGLALLVPTATRQQTLSYLRERELVSSAYVEKTLSITLADGRIVPALTYVVDPEHVQYCGSLTREEQAEIISRAVGGRGDNSEYLHNTARHLGEMGISDPNLSWLSARVRALTR
jgi:cation transport protein ChaC